MTGTLTVKRRGVKEPSIEQLAKGKARGNGHAAAAITTPPKDLSTELKAAFRDRAKKLADAAGFGDVTLAEDDHELLKNVGYFGWAPTSAEVVTIQCLFERHAKVLNKANGHPALTGNSTPAGIMANDPNADGTTNEHVRGNGKAKKQPTAVNVELGPIVSIELSRINRHPDNRHPSQADVKERAASINELGQLEPIIVRKLGNGYQILSGETRYLARKLNGHKSIDCRVRECTDGQALELVAEANAQRKDLNPIERAKLIERLCTSIEDGGSGLTRDAAAKRVGLSDGSSASNLVRLLKLPKVWQQRVAGGELPESFARLIVPYCHAPKLIEELDKEWQHDHGPKAGDDDREDWETRSELEQKLHNLFNEFTRPVDKETFAYSYKHRKRWGKVENVWDHEREFPVLFAVTPELERGLEIHEFDPSCLWEHRRRGGKDKPIRRATNCELWDKHQIPAIKERVAKSRKGKAEKAGRDEATPKRELSPAELKERRKQMTQALNGRREAWRDKLLRRACIEALDAALDSGLRIVLAAAADDRAPYGAISFHEALEHVRGVKPRSHDWRAEYWPCVAEIGQHPAASERDKESEVICDLAKAFLAHEPKDWRRPTLPHSLVESYATAIGVNLNQAWSNIQGSESGRELLEEFFLIHQTEPLRELAQELGVFAAATANRGGIVKLLMSGISGSTSRRLPLPKCIKPLGGVPGKRKAKK